MDTQQGVYVPLAAQVLADWLDRDPDLYWTVDGDRRLATKISSPCPGDELAGVLRTIDQPLLVFDRRQPSPAKQKSVDVSQLDGLVETEELRTRVLQFQWEDSPTEWILIEDKETSESVARESQSH
ncbi:MAG: hypothetical protein V3R99_10295 [Thermoguttaceae bacterium]